MWAIGRPMGYWILVNDFSREGDVRRGAVGLDIGADEEQRRNELRGLGGIEGNRLVLVKRLARDTQRREAFFAQIVNLRAYLTQGVHQLTYRAMVHAFYAVQDGCLSL